MCPLTNVDASIINTAIGALPAIIGLFKREHAAANPGAAPLTSEQVIAALRSDAVADVLKDEQLLAQLNQEG